MKARIRETKIVLTGSTIQQIRKQMNAMLHVDGKHALTADTDTGKIIHVELLDGQDYVINNPAYRPA